MYIDACCVAKNSPLSHREEKNKICVSPSRTLSVTEHRGYLYVAYILHSEETNSSFQPCIAQVKASILIKFIGINVVCSVFIVIK